jgi:predicted TIM-barrel fold metal-dependent hydrolase
VVFCDLHQIRLTAGALAAFEQAKRNILGLNAARIFNLDPTPVKKLIAS